MFMVTDIMTEVRFYHLERTDIKAILPSILEKALERGMRGLIYCSDQKQVKMLDQWLWAYKPTSFLPHGCDGDPRPDQHPIWITTLSENANNADLLIIVDALGWADVSDFKVCCEIFDGGNADIVAIARKKWSAYKEKSDELSYWQQDDQGRWINKVSS